MTSKKKKWCPGCSHTKRIVMFGINRSRPDGLQGWCIECMDKNNKKMVKKNKAKWKDNDPHKGSK